MQPTGFYLLVRPDDDVIEKELGKKREDGMYERDSGLVIPETADSIEDVQRERAAQEYGTLLAIGPIAWNDYADGQNWAEVGDRVCFAKYAGKFVEDPETRELLILLQDTDIVAVIKDKLEEEVIDAASR